MNIINHSARIISISHNPLKTVEFAARLCYKSENQIEKCPSCANYNPDRAMLNIWHPDRQEWTQECHECIKRATNFIHKLIKSGHESVLEHASMSVYFITDRTVSHELVRHRIASFSQESTRYCSYGNEKNGISVTPPDFSTATHTDGSSAETEAHNLWKDIKSKEEEAYNKLLAYKVPPQTARTVLPFDLKTELVMTANIREWRHLLKLRLLGTTGKPHPSMINLMTKLVTEIKGTENNTSIYPFFTDILP